MKRSWRKNAALRLQMLRLWILVGCIVIALTVMLGSTSAWFTGSDSVNNSFKTQEWGFSFKVEEVWTPPSHPDPGDNVPKVVSVTNDGDLPGFVRVLVLTEILSADGEPLPADASVLTFDNPAAATDWVPVDGRWYYMRALAPGETTPPIFTGVTFAPTLPAAYKDAVMKIEVKVEAAELKRWVYRESWWGSDAEITNTGSPLYPVDDALKHLAQ